MSCTAIFKLVVQELLIALTLCPVQTVSGKESSGRNCWVSYPTEPRPAVWPFPRSAALSVGSGSSVEVLSPLCPYHTHLNPE